MTVHSPHKPDFTKSFSVKDDSEENEESLVFTLCYGQVKILFTADAGFIAEQRMLADGRDLKSTILKVGHHGSRYSTSQAFLDKVRPQAALISAGTGNRFGLPSPETVSQLEKSGIRTYRTDTDGTIELVSNGISWNVTTPYASERPIGE